MTVYSCTTDRVVINNLNVLYSVYMAAKIIVPTRLTVVLWTLSERKVLGSGWPRVTEHTARELVGFAALIDMLSKRSEKMVLFVILTHTEPARVHLVNLL